ncbi:MAG: hypothetical protein Fues2KO_21560 [Fuerstiella sp.]
MSEAIPTIINEFDVQSVFADWSQEDWAKHAGRILVLAVNPKTATRSFITSVADRREFDVDEFVADHRGQMIQFFELPATKGIGPDPEAVTNSANGPSA